MPTSLKRVALAIPKELEEELTALAGRERRPLANLCLVLIEEALAARSKAG